MQNTCRYNSHRNSTVFTEKKAPTCCAENEARGFTYAQELKKIRSRRRVVVPLNVRTPPLIALSRKPGAPGVDIIDAVVGYPSP